jgi:hypothetical protein
MLKTTCVFLASPSVLPLHLRPRRSGRSLASAPAAVIQLRSTSSSPALILPRPRSRASPTPSFPCSRHAAGVWAREVRGKASRDQSAVSRPGAGGTGRFWAPAGSTAHGGWSAGIGRPLQFRVICRVFVPKSDVRCLPKPLGALLANGTTAAPETESGDRNGRRSRGVHRADSCNGKEIAMGVTLVLPVGVRGPVLLGLGPVRRGAGEEDLRPTGRP